MRKILLVLLASVTANIYSQEIGFQEFAYDLNSPVEITNAGDDRLFVVELGGSIKIVNPDGTKNPDPFLTLPPETVMGGSERGLLGLAFHPQYATNGFFYVLYTRPPDGTIVIAQYNVDPQNPNIALATSALQILEIPHPSESHNGGTMRFGPDGYLYIGIGDGYSDLTNAQNINLNLGKMLRLDVNNATQAQPYAIPPGNPFVGIDGNDEIWAVGLRNPWKFSFDSLTNDLWIADVGSNSYEEINHVPSTLAGVNYGWICYEANNQLFDCDSPTASLTFPFTYYAHSDNLCSIIGGFVYRGTAFPELQNKYVFADLCSNSIWYSDTTTGAIAGSVALPGPINYFTTLGVDDNQELYIASSSTGIIYKIVNANLGRDSFAKQPVSIAPNPASHEFKIRMGLGDFPAQVTVSDLTGKKLIEKNVDSDNAAIAIENLQDGIYMVSILGNSGAQSKTKMAVSK